MFYDHIHFIDAREIWNRHKWRLGRTKFCFSEYGSRCVHPEKETSRGLMERPLLVTKPPRRSPFEVPYFTASFGSVTNNWSARLKASYVLAYVLAPNSTRSSSCIIRELVLVSRAVCLLRTRREFVFAMDTTPQNRIEVWHIPNYLNSTLILCLERKHVVCGTMVSTITWDMVSNLCLLPVVHAWHRWR